MGENGTEEIFSTPKRRRFHAPRYVQEIKTPDVATPRRARRILKFVKNVVSRKSKKIKVLHNKNRLLRKRIAALEQLLAHLRSRGLMDQGSEEMMLEMLPTGLKRLVTHAMKRKRRYTSELKSFALTLHFYSPKAYTYVRKYWNNILPHPSTNRQWYKVVDGDPGFTQEVFDALARQTEEKKVVVNLVLDEMSIRENLTYHAGRHYGGMDIGTVDAGATQENITLATNALVVMAVPLNHHWKIPLGYFLIRGLTSKERANILLKTLD